MAKMSSSAFVALLLFVACTNQANASPFSTNLTEVADSIKNQVVELVNKTSEEVKDGVHQLNTLVQNTFQAAKEVAANNSQHITDEYNSVVERVQEIISSNSIFSHECHVALDAFRAAYAQLLEQANSCVDIRIRNGVSHLTNINSIADEVLLELSHVRDEAIHCTLNVHGAANFLQALTCVNAAALKATWYVGKRVPPLTLEMSKLGANILMLPPQIGYCYSSQFISVIGSNYRETLNKINQCLLAPPTTEFPTTYPH